LPAKRPGGVGRERPEVARKTAGPLAGALGVRVGGVPQRLVTLGVAMPGQRAVARAVGTSGYGVGSPACSARFGNSLTPGERVAAMGQVVRSRRPTAFQPLPDQAVSSATTMPPAASISVNQPRRPPPARP
jgi:hypothetical protein